MVSREQYEEARREFDALKKANPGLYLWECGSRECGKPPSVSLFLDRYTTPADAREALHAWADVALKTGASLNYYPRARGSVSLCVTRLMEPEEVNHVVR